MIEAQLNLWQITARSHINELRKIRASGKELEVAVIQVAATMTNFNQIDEKKILSRPR